MSNVPPYQPMPPQANPNDQRPTYVLVAGILSLVCCGLAGIYSIIVGNTLKKEYGGTIPSPGNIGYILGIVGLVLNVLGGILYGIIVIAAVGSSTTY
jgi:hypothetical protein